MYDENEKKINWHIIIKRLIGIICVLVIIFGIVALITKCTKNDKPSEKPNEIKENINLDKQLGQMQDATLKYITKDNLPTELNASKTIKLKYLINKKLIGELKNGKITCDTDKSYSEVTRLENNYAVRISLTCGDIAKKIIYVGCFESCEKDKVCVGTAEMTNGICIGKSQNEEKPSNNQTTTAKPSQTTTKPSQTITKPSTQKPAPTKPSTSSKKTLYEFKRCTTNYYCKKGQLNDNNVCETLTNKTYYGRVIEATKDTATRCKESGYTYNSSSNACTKSIALSYKNTTTTKYFTSTSKLLNEGYTYVGYVKGQGYKGTKTISTPYCSQGKQSGNACVITGTVIKGQAGIPAHCKDSSYKYDASTNKCSLTKVVTTFDDPITKISCQTVWSTNKTLKGWTFTGKTKVE